jgi:DNA-binding CsgD family transcriptional regulator
MAIAPDDYPREFQRRELQIRAVARRVSPALLIVDLDLRPLGWSPNSEAKRILADVGPEFKLVIANCHKLHEPAIHIVDADTLLRIIPLETADAPCVGIQVESFRRSSFASAAKAYRLTKRETEILQLVVEGASNAQIAQALFIAQSTVADHIKSVMQKTQTTKRTRLISKFVRDDEWRFADTRPAIEPL